MNVCERMKTEKYPIAYIATTTKDTQPESKTIMSDSEPTATDEGLSDPPCSLPCFECETGRYETVYRTYKAELKGGDIVYVKNVPHEICNECGDVCFSSRGSEIIQDAIFGENK